MEASAILRKRYDSDLHPLLLNQSFTEGNEANEGPTRSGVQDFVLFVSFCEIPGQASVDFHGATAGTGGWAFEPGQKARLFVIT